MKNLCRFLCGFGFIILLSAGFALASGNESKNRRRAEVSYDIKVVPAGPTQAEINQAKARIQRYAKIQNLLKNVKHRFISFDYVENGDKLPTHFQAVFFDYTNDKTFVATGDFAGKEKIRVSEADYDPGINDEEIDAAYRLIKADSYYGNLYKQGKIRFYEPMPPISDVSGERLVNVGIRDVSGKGNQIVGVSFKNGKIVHYQGDAPLTAVVHDDTCGPHSADQEFTGPGVAGQYQLTVSQNGAPLWEMLVIRPSASSGTHRSGIELRDVKYKGKTVFKRAHTPVLNVQYDPRPGQLNCGPYRDWQYSEDYFDAPAEGAVDPAPGIRIVADGKIARTILNTNNDFGNFQGVAIYQQDVGFGKEIVLITEMNAGWYRYMAEYRFAPDGTIRPRYGFGATENACTCARHQHHVYWRFDFDIVNPANKLFQIERGRKFMSPIKTEDIRFNRYQTNRSVLIQNSNGDEAYLLVPNLTDGIANYFHKADFWFLKYRSVPGGTALANEIDDAYRFYSGECTDTTGSCININSFANGESLVDEDVVVWYGASFKHDEEAEDDDNSIDAPQILTGDHVVGPDLRPVRW